MTQLTDKKSLTNGEIWRIVISALFLSSMWYDLKTDQIKTQKDIDFIQYQINELKSNERIIPRQTAYFIKPHEPRIKKKYVIEH